MTLQRLHFCVVAFALFIATTVIGCGPGRGDLSGAVSFEGKTVSSGSVTVGGSDGVPKSSEIGPDGAYLVKDIAAGKVKITVYSPDPGAVKYIPRKEEDKPPPPKDRSKWFAIPEDYNDFNKSGLEFPLKRGTNNKFDITLMAK